ncbi:MAG: VC0807 family protein [Chloroflexota bacterium]
MTVDAPAVAPQPNRSHLRALAPMVVLDILGPAIAYYLLRHAGQTVFLSLMLGATLPALGVALDAARHRRLDAIGLLVLTGSVVLGLVSQRAQLVLLAAAVPTAVFGTACIVSLWSRRPLMYRFALEMMGAGTPKGIDFADRWQYPGFRHAFRVTTIVWGAAFLMESAAQATVTEAGPVGVAAVTSNVLPLGVAAVVIAWNVAYAKHAIREGERAAREAWATSEPTSAPSTQDTT